MEKRKIILDCDPGHDDAIAMMMAAKHPAIDLLGITIVAGNQTLDKTLINGLKTQEMYVEVDVNSGPCYGRTVCDELGVLGKPANTKVGITIDTDWFWGLVEECVRGYIKTH
ncbi:TPA: nucleoside hydrolase [Escherichia coli]|uniref:nucleoside hydrolase n=1 Tax=Escherichia coli TaxID=562 RepID=UPI0018ABB509|nr:nucleoside hydrolase [Escherichia coli]EJA4358189.1 nucleoside hydrolase [Escherichia coli]EKL4575630.1 nucleoside hydrolase [Escherichia coli]MCH4680714.1 nucleoside hydrolase [Escherichia coli]MCH6226682.1 nucleoside hydrolase [Escherichia coli]MCH6370932.1 nucleoside hydrolase [Escherichia coli]